MALLASKHDFFLSGMISCRLSFTCTVQFLLSTAKGRCLWVQIHFHFSLFSSNRGGRDGRLVLHFGEYLTSRARHFLPAETGRISGSLARLAGLFLPSYSMGDDFSSRRIGDRIESASNSSLDSERLMSFDPSTDPRLISLKRIAEGGGERGPRFDKGVLSVIDALLKDGHFVRNRMVGIVVLFNAQRQVTPRLLTTDEEAQLQSFLKEKGWTLEQATEFLNGVDLAERALGGYEARNEP